MATEFEKKRELKAAREKLEELWVASFLDKFHRPAAQTLVKLLVSSSSPEQDVFRQSAIDVMRVLEGKEVKETGETQEATDVERIIRHGLSAIVVSAISKKMDEKDLSRELTVLKMPKSFTADLCKLYKKRKISIANSLSLDSSQNLPSIEDLRWRVDVTISTNSVSRVFTPVVIFQLTLTDGRIRTFQCTVDKFHEFRYNISKVLKNMQDLNHHPTLVRAASAVQ